MCVMSLRIDMTLPTWYFETIGYFMISLFQDILDSQVLSATCEDLFFIRLVDAWLYHKFVHPWHVGRFVSSYANPHVMRYLWWFVFPYGIARYRFDVESFSRRGEWYKPSFIKISLSRAKEFVDFHRVATLELWGYMVLGVVRKRICMQKDYS